MDVDDRHTTAHPPATVPRILWGRVAFYGLSLVVVFGLGMWTGSDDSAEAELEQARSEIDRLSDEVVNLRAETEALRAGEALDDDASGQDAARDTDDGGPTDDDADDGGPTEGTDDTETTTSSSAPEGSSGAARDVYVVREGDTGHAIAERLYGDRELWPLIAEANQVGDDVLRVDQELVIPPAD